MDGGFRAGVTSATFVVGLISTRYATKEEALNN